MMSTFFENKAGGSARCEVLPIFYLKAQFEDGEIDYRKYRTDLNWVGARTNRRKPTPFRA